MSDIKTYFYGFLCSLSLVALSSCAGQTPSSESPTEPQIAVAENETTQVESEVIEEEPEEESAPDQEIDWSTFDATIANNESNSIATEAANRQPKTWIKLKNPDVEDTIDKRIVQKVARMHSNDLKACYEKELAKMPKATSFEAMVEINWTITPEGAVKDPTIQSSTLNNDKVESCVIHTIENWRYPSPKGGVEAKVVYPIVFILDVDH